MANLVRNNLTGPKCQVHLVYFWMFIHIHVFISILVHTVMTEDVQGASEKFPFRIFLKHPVIPAGLTG